MATRMFTVTETSWAEHVATWTAAINDPVAFAPEGRQSNAQRQAAIAEISGIRSGDRLFFYMQRDKQVLGGYEATTRPFFAASSLVPGGFIDYRFPFRVGFRKVRSYANPLHIDAIWASRDAGAIWTIQQSRGDVVGRHACTSLAKPEGDLLTRMLEELNPRATDAGDGRVEPAGALAPLPLDTRTSPAGRIHYENSMKAMVLDRLGEGAYRDVLGDYDDFLTGVPTSAGGELDLLLLKYDGTGGILWYEVVEMKADRFGPIELGQLLNYETWLTGSQAAGNPRCVHMVALAHRFESSITSYLEVRRELGQKPVTMVQYGFDGMELVLTEAT